MAAISSSVHLFKEAAGLLKQHRRLFQLQKQVDQRVYEENSDLKPDEYIDDPEYFDEIIRWFAKDDSSVTELVSSAARAYFGVGDPDRFFACDPISQGFYDKLHEIAEQLAPLSVKLREQYLTLMITAIHTESPELDLEMYTFVRSYVQVPTLVALAAAHLATNTAIASPPDLDKEGTSLHYYEPIIAYDRGQSLNVLQWAKKNKKNRDNWLLQVQGENDM
jgi:hypothetical protein